MTTIDSRNVRGVENAIAAAHKPEAKFTRLETKQDIMQMINETQ